ncbi:hypothetical protein BJY16_005212 [Actinoplanes octamycinicus]|uniref:Uncharacterized protein n=1 Tax=Actinoplanes octamycinicus TaxID=135948 RepID=A0A7W7M982_9ACTN|nr:hypothetical protein [Actinoplanes octamycinicus]MBB4741753.1 hypothetical protein [Actinoplanes octamycinicus]
MAALKVITFALEPITSPPEAPREDEFVGTWCSPHGDRLVLAGDRFKVDPMSPVLAGQISFRVPTPKPGSSPRWNDPPATTAAGSWGVFVLGADVMAGRVTTLDMEFDTIGQDAVISDMLELDTYEGDAGWSFSLPLKPSGSGDMTFGRCEGNG